MRFTKLTRAAPCLPPPFLATQISENSGKLTEIFWSFLKVQASNTACDTQPPHRSTTVLCKSLLFGRGLCNNTGQNSGGPGLWPQLTNNSRSSADNAGFNFPFRKTSQQRIFTLSFQPLLPQKKSSKAFVLLWSFLCCFNYKRQALVYWINSPVWALVSRCSHPPPATFSLSP